MDGGAGGLQTALSYPAPTLKGVKPSWAWMFRGSGWGQEPPAGGMLSAAGIGAVLGDGWEKKGDERCSAR